MAQDPAGTGQTAATPTAPASPQHFFIHEYRVEGNTVLSRAVVEKAVYPFLGENRAIDDVEQARKSLDQAYHDAGYPTVYVDIPQQDVVGGAVRLRVTEGHIGRVRVVGSHYYSLGRIREKIPALAQGTVPSLPQMQQELGALNRASADRQVVPVFRAGATPGKVDVDLRVKDELPLHASLEMNNRYSANTSHLRAVGMVRYDNLWQREHSLSLQYQTSPRNTSDVNVYSGTYVFRNADARVATAIYAVHSNTNVAAVGDLSVIGKGDIYGLRRIYPLPGARDYSHSLTLGVDYKSFREAIFLQGTQQDNTPIRYLPFTTQYNGNVGDAHGHTQFDVGLNFSIRALSERTIDCFGQQVSQFECKRYNARADYAYLKADVQRTQNLPLDGTAFLRLSVQYADQPLIDNEQLVAGGADTVRGYLEAESLGDEGVIGSIELRHGWDWLARIARLDELNLHVFVDDAQLSIKDPLPGQATHSGLLSIGLGLHFGAQRNLTGDFDWAWPLKDGPTTHAHDSRGLFRLNYGF
ncbi:MAG: ShlB/FhaC/HecB family hemolysin secretion/activation protein [Sulfuricaulis sp.]